MWDIRKTIFQNFWNKKFILVQDTRENKKVIDAIKANGAAYVYMDCTPYKGDGSVSMTITDQAGNSESGMFFDMEEMKRTEDVRKDMNYCVIGDLNYE
jgi:hypothetical protein